MHNEETLLDSQREIWLPESMYISNDRVGVFFQSFGEIAPLGDQYLLCEDEVILSTEDEEDILLWV